MLVHDKGHLYAVVDYPTGLLQQEIQFVKKVGARFPGNSLPESDGTNCQEVIRVLIDRCKYLNSQIPSKQTTRIIELLRNALYLFEYRAADQKDNLRGLFQMSNVRSDLVDIESVPACTICGHIMPHSHLE